MTVGAISLRSAGGADQFLHSHADLGSKKREVNREKTTSSYMEPRGGAEALWLNLQRRVIYPADKRGGGIRERRMRACRGLRLAWALGLRRKLS